MSLHSLLLGPGEHALYAGGADGRIFEVPLAGQLVASLGAPPDLVHDEGLPGRCWAAALEGHSRTVTCLEATTDGGYMLSGVGTGLVLGCMPGFAVQCLASHAHA